MTRRLFLAAAVGVMTFVATQSWAHDEFRFVGTLVRVELARERVFVKFKEADGKDETVQIALKKDTEYTRDKKKIDRSQLKAGLKVVVDALGDDYDNLEAVAIRIVP